MSKLMDIVGEAGNLHFNKQYESAIELLDKYFEYVNDRETLAQFHIGYAINYEKLKDIEKCNYHCEEAVKLCHFGTYAYRRLIINYVKAKDWNNALRICDKVFENERVFDHRRFFKDKKSTWEEISSYALRRKEFILKNKQKEQTMGDNIKNDEDKTKEELLAELKELKGTTIKEDSKKEVSDKKPKKKRKDKHTIITVIIAALLLPGIIIGISLCSIEVNEKSKTKSIVTTTKKETVEYMLATLHKGFSPRENDPIVMQFKNLLDKIERKTVNTRMNIADITVKAQRLLKEKGIERSLLQILNDFNDSIPNEATGLKLEEVASLYMLLMTN